MSRASVCALALALCSGGSLSAQTVIVDEFDDPSSESQYTVTNPYGSGGVCTINPQTGKLELKTGVDNTCTIVRNDGSHFLNVGECWGVDVDGYGTSFLLVSTVPGQPNGASSFGLRLRRDQTWRVQSYTGESFFDTTVPTVVRHAPRGGGSGDPWDDFVESGGNLGRITQVAVKWGDVVDSITVFYGGGRQIRRGGTGGSNSGSLNLAPGEVITQVELRQREIQPIPVVGPKYTIVSSIGLVTNRGQRVQLGNASSGTSVGTIDAPSGVIAFCGRSGDYLDQLGVYERRPGTLWVDRPAPETFELYFEETMRGNRALSGVARQSSDFSTSFPAALGNDGNLSTFSHTASLDTAPWWEVELEDAVAITSITLRNRRDCCWSRLRDITVSVLDEAGPSGTVLFESDLLNPENALGGSQLNAGPSQLEVSVADLAGGPVTGRVVRVERVPDPNLSGTGGQGNDSDRNVLSLAEVVVLGYAERHRTFLGSFTRPELASHADLYVGFEGFGWNDTFLFDNLREEVIPVISPPPRFRRGDSNASGLVDISDAIATLGVLFLGTGSITCDDAADTDDSGTIDITDPIRALGYLFLGGMEIPAPGAVECGPDPTEDLLGCADYEAECAEPPPPGETCENPVSLRVLAYNTHLFEDSEVECLCRCGETWKDACQWEYLVHEDGPRRQEIVNRVKDCGADVVLLQEVWANAWQEWFATQLKTQYPHAYYVRTSCDAAGVYNWDVDTCLWSCASVEGRVPGTDPSFTLSNGLVLLSKWELVEKSFKVFPTFHPTQNPPSDFWARKCVLAATVLVGEGLWPVRLGVSHTLTKDDDERSEWPREHERATMTAFDLGGRPYVFGIDPPPSDKAWICAIEDYGFLDPETEVFQDGAGWRQVHEENQGETYVAATSFEIEGQPYLFLVTSGNEWEIVRIEDDPSQGWTRAARDPLGYECLPETLVSFELGGEPHIFFLSQSGEGVILEIQSNPAQGCQEVYAAPWGESVDPGYRGVTSFELSGVPYLLGVDSSGRHGVLVRVETPPAVGWTEVYSGDLGFELLPRTITSLDVDGQPYVFGLSRASKGVFLTLDPDPTPAHAWQASPARSWGFGVPEYNAVESFTMEGRPYLFAIASCCTEASPSGWTTGKNACGFDRPSEAYFKRVRVVGVPDVSNVYQLEDLKIIRDETVDGSGYPAIMMGDFNVHEAKYGFMNAIFHEAGAVDAYVEVHGSGVGGATVDGFRNQLHRLFMAEGASVRLDDVYFTPSGAGWKLVPTDARVIRDWKYGADMDLSDHYPIVVHFDLCADEESP